MSWKPIAIFIMGSLILAGTALAFTGSGMTQYEVRLPQSQFSPAIEQPDGARAALLLPSLGDFQAREGANWQVLEWDPVRRTPSTLAGPGIQLFTPGASDETIQAAAEAFIARNAALLRVDPTQLRLGDITQTGENRHYVIFDQYYRGLPVMFGRVDLGFWQGKLTLIGSDAYNGIDLPVYPVLDASRAVVAAQIGLPTSESDEVVQAPRLVILPIHQGDAPVYHLAWELSYKTTAPENVWRTYVDASTGDVLWREGTYTDYTIDGNVNGTVEVAKWGDPPTTVPFEDIRVRANTTYQGYADEMGYYMIEVPNNTSYSVQTQCLGRYANVSDALGNASLTQTGAPGTPVDFLFNDSNSELPERDAYWFVNNVHDWVKAADPTITQMDTPMTTNVNLSSGTCNAFWNGSSINFYREGGGCNNTARMSDVVYHEYGHGLTQRLYSPYSPPTSSGMGEGFSDIASELINNDPDLGEYFYVGNPSGLRDAENLRQYPGTECGGEIYCLSEIISGALWKTRKNFNLRYGDEQGGTELSRLHVLTVKARMNTMPNYLTRLLMNDDTDGDLTNGTTNWYEICDGFALHNLPCPALTNYVTVESTPLDDQPQESGGYTVTAIAVSVGAGSIDPSQVKIFYSVVDSLTQELVWQDITMTATGNPNEYAGDIPHQGCGKYVRYYVRAQKYTGEYATAPDQAPYRGTYQFMTGPFSVQVQDNFETDQGWTIGWAGDNATQGFWERVDPVGKSLTTFGATQPEDDHTAAGTLCFVTDGRGGAWTVYDVDGGKTSFVSPAYNWADSRGFASVDFWSFFFDYAPTDDMMRVAVSNDDGATWVEIFTDEGMGINDWYNHKIYIDQTTIPFTSQMRFRFSMEDIIQATSCAEAAIDDVEIRLNSCVTDVAEGETLPARFFVDPCQPNPFNPKTMIRFGLPSAGRVTASIFDVAGRKVRSLANGQKDAGIHNLPWDGRDDQGHTLGSGVYYCSVKYAGETIRQKLTLLK